MRTSDGSAYGGRRSMSWWASVCTFLFFFMFLAFEVGNAIHTIGTGKYEGSFVAYFLSNWFYPPGVALVFFLGCSWIFIPWRQQVPIIFNRKTRKVTCEINKRIITCDWDNLEAYIKDVTTFAVGGAPLNTGVLSLSFNVRNPDKGDRMERLRIGIMGTEDATPALLNRGIYGAAMIWEYIRLYMREGADAVPPICPIAKYRIDHISEPFKQFNPLKVLKVKPWWLPVAIPFFIFVALPLAPVAILGDLLYMALDRILPRRKWPQEMLDACDHVWDGQDD